jgi:hypothetical protein
VSPSPPPVPAVPEAISEEAKLNYAWAWFNYHASQRLTAFNFFLVLIGLLLVTYAQAVHNDWVAVGTAVAALGALVSVGFWALDVRNQELITCGVKALRELEDEAGLSIVPPEDDRSNLASALGASPCRTGLYGRMVSGGRGHSLFMHRTWLRLILSAVGLMYVAGAVWAGVGFPGAPGRDPSKRPVKVRRTNIHAEVGGAIINSTR